jgi:epoxyqueuosine reductase
MIDNGEDLKSRLRQLCLRKGAVVFGVASAAEVDSLPRVTIGPMMKWLYDTELDETKKPTEAMSDAKSVVVFGIPSTDDAHELAVVSEDGNTDYPGYHPLSWIRRDAARLVEEDGYSVVYPYESSSPGSYKRVLKMAGIGAFGKNSLIITPEHGPWLRFSYFLTNADLEPDDPFEEDLCKDCSNCIDACPVDALTPYVVDAERCLVGVHLRQHAPGHLQDMLTQYEPHLTPATHVMCTACQLACPYTSASRRKNVVYSSICKHR